MTFYPYNNTQYSFRVSMCRYNYTNGRDSVTVLVDGDDQDREHTLYWDVARQYYSGNIGDQEGFLV